MSNSPDQPSHGEPFQRARQLFLQGVAQHSAGRLLEAEASFTASLTLLPGRASTLMNLGATQLALGRAAQALASLDAATQAEDSSAQAWCHRAAALHALGRKTEAIADYTRALSLQPDLPAALLQRANLWAEAGRAKDALTSLSPLLNDAGSAGVSSGTTANANANANPVASSAAAHLLAGQLLQALGQHEQALQPYRHALLLNPQLPRVQVLLGQLLMQLNRAEEALALWAEGVRIGNDLEFNRYLLAAHQTTHPSTHQAAHQAVHQAVHQAPSAPGHSPADYVRALFGPYAAGFDEHLVENLKYRGHEAVVDAALAARPASADASAPRFDQVLDLGCGTGLCGRRLQGHARHIEGIDLSPSMLQAARASGAYDTLTLGEVVESLHASPRRLDLVLAADVFIYIGSLDELFSALSAQLQAGALVAFSVETMSPEELTADVNGTGWCLRRSLRYAHSQAYLEGLCAANGWKWLAWQALVLREEERQAIEGAAVVMQA